MPTTGEKERRSNKIVIPDLIRVGKLEITQLARVVGHNAKVQD